MRLRHCRNDSSQSVCRRRCGRRRLAILAYVTRSVLMIAALLAAPGLVPQANADAIYAIRPDGQMLFYRYAGMNDGSFNWPVE